MVYSLTMITSITDCDALIESAVRQQKEIEYRKIQQDRQYNTVTDGTATVEASLASVIAELGSLQTVVASLPEGEVKEQMLARITTLNYKKFLLEGRKVKYGIFALLEKQYAISAIEQELAENQLYKTALEQRRTEL